MSEQSTKPHIYESLRNQELSNKRKKEIGSVAIEGLVISSEKLAKAKRLQKLGRHIAAASDVRTHRKEIHRKKLEGLKGALDSRRSTEAAAKTAVNYAKKGERSLSRSERKANLQNQFQQEQSKLFEEQGKSNDSLKGISGRIEKHGIKKEARERAKAAIRAKEQAAADQLELRRQELKLAKARTAQTRSSLLKTTMRVGHNKSNIVSAYKDAGKTQEDRLGDLQARRGFNEYMGNGSFQAKRIDEANEVLGIGKYASPETSEADLGASSIAEEGALPIDTEVNIPQRAEIGWGNIGDFVPGASAAFVESARTAYGEQKGSKKMTTQVWAPPSGPPASAPNVVPINHTAGTGHEGAKAA